MPDGIARHIRIEGRVQGVGYRAWVEDLALALGLKGWVRNRRDGSVEAVFEGPPERVAEMIERCVQGPRLARVVRVEVLGDVSGTYGAFTVRSTQ